MISYLVCYDIEDDGERARVARVLEHYGQRVQYSVFELHLRHSAQLADVREDLLAGVGESPDVRFYCLDRISTSESFSLDGTRVGFLPAAVVV